MRLVYGSAFALAVLAFVPTVYGQDAAQSVANGGIFVPGWQGKIDANEVKAGQALNNARLAPEGSGMKVTTGPAVKGIHVMTLAAAPFGSRISTASIWFHRWL